MAINNKAHIATQFRNIVFGGLVLVRVVLINTASLLGVMLNLDEL